MRIKEHRARRAKAAWWWFLLSGLLIVISITMLLFMPRAQHVTTAVASLQSIENTLFETGTVKPLQRQIIMPQSLTGPIQSIPVQMNQSVYKGDILVQLQNASQAAALSAAQVTLTQAKSALSETEREAAAAPAAFQSQFAGTLASERSSVAAAEAQFQTAQSASNATRIRANFDGTVLVVNPDGIAADGSAAPIVELVGPERQIVMHASELDAVHIKPGMTADVTCDAFPGQTWHAHVRQIAMYASDTGNNGGGQVEVDLSLDTPFQVPFDYTVNVHIVTEKHEQALTLPYSAIVQDGAGYAVYLVRQRHVEKVPVSLGITTDSEVEVTKGLATGDVVVINPSSSLHDGSSVVTHP